MRLSDGSEEVLDPAELEVSGIDGAWLCRVKHEVESAEPIRARFSHASQSDLLAEVEEREGTFGVEIDGAFRRLPERLCEA